MDEFLRIAQAEILAIVKSSYKGRVTCKKGQINLLGANANTTVNTIALLRKELSKEGNLRFPDGITSTSSKTHG